MNMDFSYTMNLEFDCAVSRQFFALRCVPQSNLRQRIEKLQVELLPDTKINCRKDGFGNYVMEGSIWQKADFFKVAVRGQARTGNMDAAGTGAAGAMAEEEEKEFDAPFYRQATGLTFAGPELSAYAKELGRAWSDVHGENGGGTGALAEYIMHSLHQRLLYRKFTTDVSTTAEEAFAGGEGVCQDYAHVMLALLRKFGFPSRYVVGIMGGEGMSHAWVEVLDGGYWYGYDPTNDCLVTEHYIKFSHGRDYKDCRINRGIFTGCAMQRQKVEAVVAEHEE